MTVMMRKVDNRYQESFSHSEVGNISLSTCVHQGRLGQFSVAPAKVGVVRVWPLYARLIRQLTAIAIQLVFLYLLLF